MLHIRIMQNAATRLISNHFHFAWTLAALKVSLYVRPGDAKTAKID